MNMRHNTAFESIAWTPVTSISSPINWEAKIQIPYISKPNALQTLNVYRPILDSSIPGDAASPTVTSQSSPRNRIWIVYIHGGAWRDPNSTASVAIEPALSHLGSSQVSDTPFFNNLAGIVSLSYTLSTHRLRETNERDPNTGMNGKHPDHIRDVTDALVWLDEYVIGPEEEYVILGHSCGATLELQACFGSREMWQGENSDMHEERMHTKIKCPSVIVGISGLYDLPGLLTHPGRHHEDLVPTYKGILEQAFGHDERVWKNVSPVAFEYKNGNPVIVLAHSPEDQLVADVQRDRFVSVLESQGWENGEKERISIVEGGGAGAGAGAGATDGGKPEIKKKVLLLRETSGLHDDVWKQGSDLAILMRESLLMAAGIVGSA